MVFRHRDYSPFCTVVLDLPGDIIENCSLHVETEDKGDYEVCSYQSDVGDGVIFDQPWHGVHHYRRPYDLLTINLFY